MILKSKEKKIIGRAERAKLPLLNDIELRARIDTGAKTSSIWATEISETSKGLVVQFLGIEHAVHEQVYTFKHYDRVRVSSSMGHEQIRYKIKMPVVIRGRKILTNFTLADRSTQVYPILIGRNTLQGKFIVDVSRGSPLLAKEKERSQALQQGIETGEDDI